MRDQKRWWFVGRRTAGPDAEEVGEELRFHIEEQVRDLVGAGWDPVAARREVLRRFGDYAEVEAACRRYRRQRASRELWRGWWGGWRQDLKLAVRGMIRRPRFAASVIVTLAVGIGATTGVFTVVDGVLMRPLPYAVPDRLVRVFEQNSPSNRWALSAVDYQAIVQRQRSFMAVAAVTAGEAALTGGDRPEWVRQGRATADVLRVLGVTPMVGRGFVAGEDQAGAAPVAVVTHAFALRRFGDPGSGLGRTLVLDGRSYQVVGVLPAGLDELAGIRADIWSPLQLAEPVRRGPFFLTGIGRLRPGTTVAVAAEDLARVSREIFPLWAASFQDQTARLTPAPLKEALVGEAGRTLLIFQVAVFLVFLIAVANVANLVLVQASARRRELEVRLALGSGRGRLTRMLVVEGLTLALVGGLVGLVLARMGVQAFRAAGPALPRLADVHLGLRSIMAAGLLALVSGAFAGAAPILAGVGTGAGALAGGERGVTGDRGMESFRALLVVLQFALAVPLLSAAALLTSSVLRLQRVDPGFDPTGVVALRISLPSASYPDSTARRAFWEQALRKVDELPAVARVGLSSGLPPDAPATYNNFDLTDRPVPAGAAQPVSPWSGVTPGFFAALGVPLLEGRMFQATDVPAGPPVVLVSRSWAERYYAGEDAVGRHLQSGGCTTCPPTTIVGVVGDLKYQGLAGGGETVYWAASQGWPASTYLVFRSRGAAASALAAARRAIRTIDPDLPLTDATTMEDRLYEAVAAPRQWSRLLGTFAAAATLLAALGIAGVLAYGVHRQRREIGVRIALGADPRGVLLLVVRRGMLHALIGATLGVVLALLTLRALRSLLFDVVPGDPTTLAAVTLFLLLVALAACYLPARQAAHIQPTEAMRVQ